MLFFEHKNSFTLQLLNLESLSVSQIQDLENFTSKRRGIFDIIKKRISIQKRLKQEDVKKLFELLNIDVYFTEKSEITTKKKSESKSETNTRSKSKTETPALLNSSIPFGKFKGSLYGDLSNSYIFWLSKKVNYFLVK